MEDDVRRRLAMQPLVLDDETIASIEALGEEPALAALAALPEDQADAVRARVIDEVGYEELAHKLDCSPSVVGQRVSRGLRAMRAELEPDR